MTPYYDDGFRDAATAADSRVPARCESVAVGVARTHGPSLKGHTTL